MAEILAAVQKKAQFNRKLFSKIVNLKFKFTESKFLVAVESSLPVN